MRYDPLTVEQFAKEIVKESSIAADRLIYMEKDVWLSYLLKSIYEVENAPNELVFKGGTSLVKCYYPHYRFSEDLDFTWIGEQQSKKVNRRNFKLKYVDKLVSVLGLGFEETADILHGVRHSQSGKVLNYFFTLPISGPGAIPHKVKINVSFGETLAFPVNKIAVKPFSISAEKIKELTGIFGEVAKGYFGEFSIPVYSKEEIACEKIRALLTRKEKINRSRDVVDLFYLSKDIDLVKTVSLPKCRSKIISALAIPAYGEIFKERVQNIDEYLNNVVEYTKYEPVYFKEINYAALDTFVKTVLKPSIKSVF